MKKIMLKDIVTSIETSKQLKNAGYIKPSIFSYYKDKSEITYLGETNLVSDDLIEFAYTSSELVESLPDAIKVNKETFVVNQNNFVKISESEIDEHSWAELGSYKTRINDKEFEYYTKYCYKNKVIALSRDIKGKYRNLISFGNNEAESRAKLILALIEEGII